MEQSWTRSSRLELVPSRLQMRTGSKGRGLTHLPNWTLPTGSSLFGSWDRSGLQKTMEANPQSSPSLNLIETEPWTPPPDAHPELRLFDFVRGAWRVLEPAVPFVDGWHI